MKLKNTVQIIGIKAEVLLGILVACECYKSFGEELTITSIIDGLHSRTSLHYSGNAFDCRIRDLTKVTPEKLTEKIKSSLTTEFDIILEKDHIHIEWQPKK